jgi:hypothetical protein
MFAEYIQAALRRAEYNVLEDGTYMATVEGLRGVIAIGDTVEECRQEISSRSLMAGRLSGSRWATMFHQ